jgi:peptide/nickel transport system substrate-binding protein
MRLHLPLLAPAFLLTVAALGCRPGPDGSDQADSTIAVAFCCAAQALNPSMETQAKFLVFLPLLTEDESGNPLGALARRWEHSPDYTEWIYNLRTDVRWHDGVPVTADDVKFTLDLLTHPDVGHYPSGTVSATVLDDSTVSVLYENYPTTYDTWTVYYPKHVLEHLDPSEFYEWAFWTQPVGNGAYRFVRYVPETFMEFEANPDHYKWKPRVDRVVLKFVGEAGLRELLSENVDATAWSNPADVSKLERDPRFRVYHSISGFGGYGIYWRADYSLFMEPEVRRALTMAIDRRELARLLNLPDEIPIVEGVYSPRQIRRGELREPLPYDRVAAEELLESAGWQDQTPDGIRERDGERFRFTALVWSDPMWQEMAVYVQERLRQVGIRMDIQTLDFPEVQDRLKAGEFEAAFTLFGTDKWRLQGLFGEGSTVGYRNPAVIRLLDQLAAAVDPDLQDELYSELREIFRVDMPVTVLLPFFETFFVHRRIRGLSMPFRADPVMFMDELWIEES